MNAKHTVNEIAVACLAGYFALSSMADAEAIATLRAIAQSGAIHPEEVQLARQAAERPPLSDDSARVIASRWNAAARLAAVVGSERACAIIDATAQALRGKALGDALPAALGKAAKAAKAATGEGASQDDAAAAALATAQPAAREAATRIATSKAANRARVAAKAATPAPAPQAKPAAKVKGEAFPDALAALIPAAEAMLARVGSAQLSPDDASHAARVRETLGDLLALLSIHKAKPAA